MARKRSTGSGWSLPWRIYRGQQEHRFRLLLIVVTAAVSLLVSGLLGYGLFQEYWLTPRRAVATVGQQAISLRILQQHTRYRRVQLLNEYFTYAELMQYVGAQRDQLQVRMDQIDEQLNEPLTLATQVLEQLVLAELVRMEAAKRSITVNDAEIEALSAGESKFVSRTVAHDALVVILHGDNSVNELTVEQLKLNQKPGAGDDWPHFLPAYKQRLIGKRY